MKKMTEGVYINHPFILLPPSKPAVLPPPSMREGKCRYGRFTNRPQNHIQICGEKILLPPLTRGLSWRCHDWGREKLLFSENIVSPSVFCFAKSTSLVRGRKGICCNIKGLHYSPAGSDSASAHCIRRGVHRTPAPRRKIT